MKVEYIITAEGLAEEVDIRRQLEAIGLNVILVESNMENPRDENFSRDENFTVKWKVLKDSNCIPQAVVETLDQFYDDEVEMKPLLIGNLIRGAGSDAGLSSQQIFNVIKAAYEYIRKL